MVITKFLKPLRDHCSFVDPKLRYLTKEQAKEWIKIGKSKNTHTLSAENQILKDNLSNIFKNPKQPLALVDLGCGDGRKAVQLVNDLMSHKYLINSYIAVDINKILMGEAVKNVIEKTSLSRGRCSKILSDFEKQPETISKKINSFKNREVTYLFLGNTFNNFNPQEISDSLNRILKKNQRLLVGVKCRKNNSLKEQRRISQEYLSYGNDFTYSFGYLLGLSKTNMTRVVKYDSKNNILKIFLKLNAPSNFMKKNNLAHCKKLHVLNSLKPTLKELRGFLNTKFENVETYPNTSSTQAIVLCEK